MINLLLGAPGGGKSYEAVVYHVLAAIIAGRKVITNLPLNVEEFEKIEPSSSRLISLRHPTKENPRPFSTMVDFGDTWRGDGGIGPLYVIDECHMVLPRGIGDKGTPREIEEWFAMHRHEGADVLLLTQSYRKVSANIIDLVQVVYRVRKNVALGSMGSYTRKVQDGIRGEVVNQTVRTYKKQFFSLYKSHTASNASVKEAMTRDVKPIWRHWSVIGAALVLPLGVYGLISAGNPMAPKVSPKKTPSAVVSEPALTTAVVRSVEPVHSIPVAVSSAPVIEKEKTKHPFEGLGVHVVGYIEGGGRVVYQFGASRNGQMIFLQSQDEVLRAGYKVEPVNDCAARLTYKEHSFFAVCDVPSQEVSRPLERS